MKFYITIPKMFREPDFIEVESEDRLHALCDGLCATVWTEEEWNGNSHVKGKGISMILAQGEQSSGHVSQGQE